MLSNLTAEQKLAEGYKLLKEAFKLYKQADEITYPELTKQSFKKYLEGTLTIEQVIKNIAK